MTVKYNGFLTGNAIKIIACVCMLADHIAFIYLPQFSTAYMILRAIGRIAFPLFAYLIAEGCRYTKDKKRYFLSLFLLGFVCNVAFYVAMEQIYLCVLTTFSLSVLIIFAYEELSESLKARDGKWLYPLIKLCAAICLAVLAYVMVNERHGEMDYRLTGVLLPFLVYIFKNKWLKLLLFAAGIFLICQNRVWQSFDFPIQYFGFIAVVIVALYNGERGRLNLKNLFYLFYPIHMLVLYGIAMAIEMM